MKKRILSILLVLTMLMGLIPATALTAYAVNEIVISSVGVGDFKTPSVGEWPEWTPSLTVLGRGVSLDTSVCKYDTIVGDQYVIEDYYVMNGVGFYDKTIKSWLSYNDTFTYSHTYVAYIYLKAEDGYEFDYEQNMTGKINGRDATVISDAKDPDHKICITCEFYCDITDVSLVMLYNVEAPVAGMTPADYSFSLAYPEVYQLATNKTGYVNGVRWVSEAGKDLTAKSTFVEGEEYRLQIAIVPAQKNGKNVCAFNDDITAYINGKEIVTGSWDEAYYASSELVYIYYTLPAAVAAPAEPEPPVVEDTEIHFVEIRDVASPVAFGIPEYSATVPDGADYSVFTDAAYYGRIYDGILWHNTTDNVTFNPEYDRVVPGNTYNVLVFLEAAEGYTFDMDNLKCTIDGESAQWYLIGDNPRYIGVYTSFEVPEYTVDTLDIMINVPVAGDHPAFYAETNDLAYYPDSYGDNDTGIVWEDITEGFEGELTREDTFLAGHEYRVSICVTPARGCTFATTDDGYSSVYADVNGEWASVVTSDTYPAEEYVFVVYDFTVDGEVDVMVGDINGDDTVNGKDGNLLSRALSGSYILEDITTADIDGDGSLTGKDANLLKKIIAGNM